MTELDYGSCRLVRSEEGRILVAVRAPDEDREVSVSIPWDIWLKMIHGQGKVEALREVERLNEEINRLRSVMRSLLSCAEVWYRKANPEWDGSAKAWSSIGQARLLVPPLSSQHGSK